MLTLFSLCLLYLGCFAFHQAGARRTQFAGVKTSKAQQRGLRGLGWAAAALSLVLSAGPQGWERGIPLWLAQFVLAAFACLLVGALVPKRHLSSAIVAAALAGVAAIGLLVWG